MYKYEVIIYWSEDDGTFIAEVPELPGCMAHGQTSEEALHQANEAIGLWIATAREFAIPCRNLTVAGSSTHNRTSRARPCRLRP